LGVGVPGHNTVGNNQLAKPLSYSDYFRWDSANNRVGINTLLPSVDLDVVGDASFSGNVAIGGTLTYEDVANIDAVGIITARAGIEDKTLTQGRVVFVGSNERLSDSATLTYDGTSLVSPQIIVGSALTANSTGVHVSGVSTFRGNTIITNSNQLVLLNDANTASVTVDCDGGARFHVKSYNQSVIQAQESWGVRFFQGSGTERLAIEPTGGIVVGAGGTIKTPDKIMHRGDEDTAIRFPADNNISFETAGTERLKIHSVPGNVSNHISIGSSAASNTTNYYLAIKGYERSSQGASGDTVNIGIFNQSGDTAATASIDFRLGQAAVSNTAAVRLIAGKGSGWTNTTSTRDGYFAINVANNAQVEERFRITNSGRVGINTNVPLSGTHISDGTAYGSPQNASRKATLTISAGSEASADIQLLSANYNHIFFGDSADPNTGIIHYEHTGSNVDSMVFSTAGSERLRISSGGNVQVNGGAVHLDASGELAVFETDTNLAFTNSAKLAFDFSGNVARIRTSGNGSFTGRNLGFYYANSQKLLITTDKVMFSADAKVDSNNQRDLGTSGNRWKTLYLGTQLNIAGQGASNATPRLLIEDGTGGDNDFSISQYEDGNGTYTLIGQNVQLDSSGNENILDSNHKTASMYLDARNNGAIMFNTGGTNAHDERLRIKSDGIIEIGTSIGTSSDANIRLKLGRASDCYLGIRATGSNTSETGIKFGDASSEHDGKFAYLHTGSKFRFTVGGNDRIFIEENGDFKGQSSNANIIGFMGAKTTSGTTDWNHSTNARSGNGYTLLLGTHSNGPGPSLYYHPFTFEYAQRDSNGNMTQLAIPYNGGAIYSRYRYSGSWSGWTSH